MKKKLNLKKFKVAKLKMQQKVIGRGLIVITVGGNYCFTYDNNGVYICNDTKSPFKNTELPTRNCEPPTLDNGCALAP